MITASTLTFLKELRDNNHKAWFNENKSRYLTGKKNVEDFVNQVHQRLNDSDDIEYSKMYRIYRDVRFSKDKLPYKNHFGGYFRRFGHDRRGSYVFQIGPNSTQVGGGFFGPNADDLLRIRKEFEMDGTYMQEILDNPAFVDSFGNLRGNGVKTAPRGFDKNHPNIELIRKKQFYALRDFTDEEVLRDDFVDQVHQTFLNIRPFFDYMTEVLTTDLNGVSIL